MAVTGLKSTLFSGTDATDPVLLTTGGGLACVMTRARPGRTTPNEDSAAVIPGDSGGTVLVVADGLGGLPAGDAASRIVVEVLSARVAGQECAGLREAVLSGLEQANGEIKANGQGGASTVAVAAVDGDVVRTAIVGDSMILVCGQRGRLKYCSVPHSPVGYAEASGMLNEAEAMFHADRHLVSNVVGADDMHVEVGPPLRLAPHDTIVIGSDGLFDNLYVDEVIEQVRCGDLAQAAARLFAACSARMRDEVSGQPHKPDDLTFILYRRSRD